MKKIIIILINVLTRVLVVSVTYLIYVAFNIYMYREPWNVILEQADFSAPIIIFMGVILSMFSMWGVDRIILKFQSGHIYRSIPDWILEQLSK